VRRFPERLVRIIQEQTIQSSEHALTERERLDLAEEDVASIARTTEWWQPNKDPKVPGGYLYEMTGRDTQGRRMYTAGKEIIYDGEPTWYIITIHEAD
jgi:hypothetical protein